LVKHDEIGKEVEVDLKRPTTNTITLLLNVEAPTAREGNPRASRPLLRCRSTRFI
jgi:hypothetical protein